MPGRLAEQAGVWEQEYCLPEGDSRRPAGNVGLFLWEV